MKTLYEYLEAAKMMQCCIVLKYESGGEQRGFVASVWPKNNTVCLSSHREGRRVWYVGLDGVVAITLAGTGRIVWTKAD